MSKAEAGCRACGWEEKLEDEFEARHAATMHVCENVKAGCVWYRVVE